MLTLLDLHIKHNNHEVALIEPTTERGICQTVTRRVCIQV